MKKILAVLSLAVFGASMASASADRVRLSCTEKNGSLDPFVMSFQRPQRASFSVPVEIIAAKGVNSGMVTGFVNEALIRLKGHYMLSISSNGPLGALPIEIVAAPNWESGFGYGISPTMKTFFFSCAQGSY